MCGLITVTVKLWLPEGVRKTTELRRLCMAEDPRHSTDDPISLYKCETWCSDRDADEDSPSLVYKAFHMGSSFSDEPTASYFQNSPKISVQTTRRRHTPEWKHHMKLRKWTFVWIFVRPYTSSQSSTVIGTAIEVQPPTSCRRRLHQINQRMYGKCCVALSRITPTDWSRH
jgi:hypothetical protein